MYTLRLESKFSAYKLGSSRVLRTALNRSAKPLRQTGNRCARDVNEFGMSSARHQHRRALLYSTLRISPMLQFQKEVKTS